MLGSCTVLLGQATVQGMIQGHSVGQHIFMGEPKQHLRRQAWSGNRAGDVLGLGWDNGKSQLCWCSAGHLGHAGDSCGANSACAGSGLTSIPQTPGNTWMCWPPSGGCELSPNSFAGHEQSCGLGQYGWACCPPYKYDAT